ncbi:MnhB domain-containing protein [Tindallia californiensis]|uniref:Multicomponent Na+:H+ antiporter subunit B n=1 Tax=Tindallia californiensis TaxID=159292 RepID=A0A1H3K564_9FIRM|nr:MnhB domain-containing protein [Tindallia californiensis]SDY47303.1 multicomponent Na+:H+ antiporter subunit B [Tindallia californiensis]
MDDLIVRNISRMIIPFIQLYGIFVIFHGHLSPGGGFPGGAILGASIILYTLAFGAEKGHKKLPHSTSKWLESGAIIWFILLGLFGIFTGHVFLTNKAAGFYMGEVGDIISGGFIPLVTLAIGIKVGSTMITLFHTMIEEEEH